MEQRSDRVAGSVRKIWEAKGNTDPLAGKSGCGRGIDDLQFFCSCPGLGEGRAEDYHDPFICLSKLLEFFRHNMVEDYIFLDGEHVIMKLPRFLDAVGTHVSRNHHKDHFL